MLNTLRTLTFAKYVHHSELMIHTKGTSVKLINYIYFFVKE
jgi:hypothetical protein